VKPEEETLCFRVPLLSDLDPEEQEKLKTDEAVKEKSAQLKELICNRGIDPVEKKNSLVKIIEEFEKNFPEDMMKRHILFTVRPFDSPSGSDFTPKNDFVALLSGKTIILGEKVVL
jgi:hypothetical protein